MASQSNRVYPMREFREIVTDTITSNSVYLTGASVTSSTITSSALQIKGYITMDFIATGANPISAGDIVIFARPVAGAYSTGMYVSGSKIRCGSPVAGIAENSATNGNVCHVIVGGLYYGLSLSGSTEAGAIGSSMGIAYSSSGTTSASGSTVCGNLTGSQSVGICLWTGSPNALGNNPMIVRVQPGVASGVSA